MSQKQKGLIKAKLVIEADDLNAIDQFVDHLAAKSHIAITERTDTVHPSDEGDYPRVHLSVERRACWGNWASDIRRDVAHSIKKTGSSAECSIVEVQRTVVETRSEEKANVDHPESTSIAPAGEIQVASEEGTSGSQAESANTESVEPIEAIDEPEFGELDLLAAALDEDAASDDAIATARDDDVANTLIDWRDEQAEPDVDVALADIEGRSNEDLSASV